ncbi:ATP-binding cassette domain-containing protein [Campylobacter sp. VicNov18]|uniref:phosphate ABC transporter ATP-binding protein n=1 Tax=Campylobacter bilis TaxID=2691918 RepID=UPI00130D9BDF|nr:phosphate ABC transporter ATP-binding protein [Campylobacter bilis]MPV63413.1 phosphate ABC transporter ATP-binding protein [Campylobacter hepaticus]MBM0636912.1 phosphate ABC transporter ATP-binding protein [Campylobacter bilis]MCC8277623.1 ATP-binding cassette domain-containing protein [Campylobacter bilis]MCC8299232.1 ATP-binding cassette domain-containing protein [Campylobacter bilis]MCC8300532.1 ATP-binding cassette domain-containing protein [Campylobacter bilis]
MIAKISNLNLFYGKKQALLDINMQIKQNKITTLIGASGCGKSTFLRCFNRMNDKIAKIYGLIEVEGKDVNHQDVVVLRKNVGMVFQQANVFVKSIYENISYAPRLHGMFKNKDEEEALVVDCLEKVGLFKEVKDKLKQNALVLLGGQQQRLCIARALAIKPKLLLLGEPTSALDPISLSIIEELLKELSHNLSMIMITHNMQQGKRIGDYTAFFHLGQLVELGQSQEIFENPKQEKTKAYLSGVFG